MTAQDIITIIESLSYSVFGFRAVEEKYQLNIGEDVPCSFDWDFENDCSSDNELVGASAVYICDYPDIDDINEALKKMEIYNQKGTKLMLIAGDNAGHGDDLGEVLISNAVVVCTL